MKGDIWGKVGDLLQLALLSVVGKGAADIFLDLNLVRCLTDRKCQSS